MTSCPLASCPDSPSSVFVVSADDQLAQESKSHHLQCGPAVAHYANVIALCNPQAGHLKAGQLLDQLIRPLFQRLSIPLEVYKTTQPGDAASFGQQLRARSTLAGVSLIVVLGGDGTTHELIQGLVPGFNEVDAASMTAAYHLALIPLGTANALYHYLFPSAAATKFASLQASLQSTNSIPLPLLDVAVNQQHLFAHVVASTALHASILHDSEQMRASIPGLERFQKAAQLNWARTYRGKVALDSDGPSQLQRYTPRTRHFEMHPAQSIELSGTDWVYLNAVLTDRLEETFVVAPFRKPQDADSQRSMDVVAIEKPARITAEQFSAALGQTVQAMYSGGTHVDLVWSQEGAAVPWREGCKEEDLVVQYWRCAELSWLPVSPYL